MKESDWRHFKKVREQALNRMYQRVLDQCAAICGDENRAPSDRYGELFKTVREQDKKLARVFDEFSRSKMPISLMGMRAMGLVEEAELEGFTDELIARTRPLD